MTTLLDLVRAGRQKAMAAKDLLFEAQDQNDALFRATDAHHQLGKAHPLMSHVDAVRKELNKAREALETIDRLCRGVEWKDHS